VILLWAGLIVGASRRAITAISLVRRRAPAGLLEDGDRAAGVFSVLAAGFAVLLRFVVFLFRATTPRAAA
jgi:hypothetical protein